MQATPPHLRLPRFEKSRQLTLSTHQCPIQISAPHVELGASVVVKYKLRLQLLLVPLMEELPQVVLLQHARLWKNVRIEIPIAEFRYTHYSYSAKLPQAFIPD